MLGIRCLGGQLEAHQTDDIGGCIRKVIQCIGSNGDRAEQGAHHKLAQTEQNIAHHAHHTGQIAIGGTDAGILRRIRTAYKKTDQKLRHKSSFRAAHFQRAQCLYSITFCLMVLKAFQKFHPFTPDIKLRCSTKRPGGLLGCRVFSEIPGLCFSSPLRLRRSAQVFITGSGFRGRRYQRCRASRRSRSASGSGRRHRSRCRRCRSCPAGQRWPASEQYRHYRTSERR